MVVYPVAEAELDALASTAQHALWSVGVGGVLLFVAACSAITAAATIRQGELALTAAVLSLLGIGVLANAACEARRVLRVLRCIQTSSVPPRARRPAGGDQDGNG